MEKLNTLCIIEDNDVTQFLLQQMVEETQMVKQVKLCSNGLRAIEYLRALQDQPELLPEMILLDLAMPVMDGWRFLEEYRKIKPQLGKSITIYIVTSSIDPADVQKAKTVSEVADFIVKPVTKSRFLDLVRELKRVV
ncbi:response regulator [Rapidithrix thailandica]|uniref:Response regulator n=1 Tax=Rapidithrix thailandica TaxID=413964 RepID=A0AAW9S115_9BACT